MYVFVRARVYIRGCAYVGMCVLLLCLFSSYEGRVLKIGGAHIGFFIIRILTKSLIVLTSIYTYNVYIYIYIYIYNYIHKFLFASIDK